VAEAGRAACRTVRVQAWRPYALCPGEQVELERGLGRSGQPRRLAGRQVTLWVDQASLHVLLDGTRVKTVPSLLGPPRWPG
jgi:hypothetical protein